MAFKIIIRYKFEFLFIGKQSVYIIQNVKLLEIN